MAPIEEPASEKTRPGETNSEKIRVLLADDNPAVLHQVSGLLAEDFHVVAALSDGQTAVHKYLELGADVLILDISMGTMSGLDVARSLWERGVRPHLIFLTVHCESDFVRAAMACGASGYVVKSHLINDLIPAIRATLSGNLFISPCVRELSRE